LVLVENISINDISQELIEEITAGLSQYCVAIYAFYPEGQNSPFRLIGTGTLVEIEGTYGILTAGHVWDQLRGSHEIGITLTDYSSCFRMKFEHVHTVEKPLWNPQDEEWGPDLALIKLAPLHVSTIIARKSFLNLKKQHDEVDLNESTEKKCWVAIGLVGEFSDATTNLELNRTDVNARIFGFLSTIEVTHQNKGYDYLDLSVNTTLPGVPSTFVGVSGGGLWKAVLVKKKSGLLTWDEKPYLRGVAFWESPIIEGKRVIRCHGPRSIYENAWKVWNLPQ